MPTVTPCGVVRVQGRLEELPGLLARHDGERSVLLEWGGVAAAGNIVCNRAALYKILGVGSDGEAYRRLLAAIEAPREPPEEAFREHYEEVGDVKLPAVRFYECDGGPYLTGSVIIGCIGGTCNASIHRMMAIGPREYVVRVVPRHLHRMLSERRPLPVAVVLGAHPLVELAAATSPPYGVFELGVAASLGWRSPVCRTPRYSIPVPCDAGVVLEGLLGVGEADEGPFADILLLCDRVRRQPVLRVESVYVSRSDVWAWQVLPGGEEHRLLMGFPREALIWDSVRRAVGREPRVRLVKGGGGWLAAVIGVEVDEANAKIALMAAFAAHPSLKIAIVTHPDIDVDNEADLLWAIATRLAKPEDVAIVPEARVSSLDPSSRDGVGVKLGIVAVPRGDVRAYRRPKLAG